MTNGTSYTVTVRANNAAGTGPGATSNSVTPKLSQPAAETASADATPTATQDAVVSTSGTSPTVDNPIITSVSVPAGGNAGMVSIAESSPSATSVSTGGASYSVLGQQVDVTAPAQTADNPLTATFVADASTFSGKDPATLDAADRH